MRARLNSLRLAEAVLEKVDATRDYPDHPLQIVVLGPTQAGKSTLINLLSGHNNAGVSALAGYTVHAQGFTSLESASESNLDKVLERMFPGYSEVQQDDLAAHDYSQYSLNTQLDQSASILAAIEQPVVLWDSPDFDSIESGGYRTAVLQVAALADVIVFVLSKDKYADRSVWDMMALLEPLQKPTLYIINKLNQEDLETVSDSFNRRFRENTNEANRNNQDAKPALITLPYIRNLEESAQELQTTAGQPLADHLKKALGGYQRDNLPGKATKLLNQHWPAWIEPLQREHRAHEEWCSRVDSEIENALRSYREGYIDHPQKYDTFNRAIAELLILLEIPGLASTLSATREVVTWPVRKLFGIGRAILTESGGQEEVADHEQETLLRVHRKTLSELQNLTMDHGDSDNGAWWLAMNRSLRSADEPLTGKYQQNVEQYRKDFEPEIEQAAQALYKTLQDQPAVLNGLRAARVTTDAAAVVLAVHAGGLAASDLLIAPAMLSVTSMLTEGALGKYMDTVKQQLKEKQFETVQTLLREEVGPELKNLGLGVKGESVFGVTPDELEQAELKLQNLRSGNRS